MQTVFKVVNIKNNLNPLQLFDLGDAKRLAFLFYANSDSHSLVLGQRKIQ